MKSPIELWISSICQQGGARQNIEDCIFIRNYTYEQHAIIGVSDGMGGLEYGEAACAEVCKTFNSPITGDPSQHLLSKLARANEKLFSQKDKQGATLSVIAIDKFNYTYSALSVGDSRIYKYSNLQLSQLSTDDKPLLGQSPMFASALTKAIGIREEIPDLSVITGILANGESILLTTDGIHSSLDDSEIRETIQMFNKAHVVNELARQAILHGSKDDMSAIFMYIR